MSVKIKICVFWLALKGFCFNKDLEAAMISVGGNGSCNLYFLNS